MDGVGRERPGGRGDFDFVAFDEVEDVDGALGVVADLVGEPVAADLDELQFVEAGALLGDAVPAGEGLDAVDEVLAGPRAVALPGEVAFAVVEVDGAGMPSRPTRPQSQSLNVKMNGVAEISRTIEFAPEEWMVPAGMRKWSCFFAGKALTYFSASNGRSPVSAARRSASMASLSTPSLVPR
nr:hypothetical protein GCM10025732_34730 [Glycomyces mayteni]